MKDIQLKIAKEIEIYKNQIREFTIEMKHGCLSITQMFENQDEILELRIKIYKLQNCLGVLNGTYE